MRAAELRRELETELAGRTVAATAKAKRRVRTLVVAAVAIALIAIATYALVLRPTLEEQRFEIQRLTQEVEVLQHDNDRLERQRDELRQELKSLPTPTQAPALREQPKKAPTKHRRPMKPTRDRQAIPGLELTSDDPLEGLD